MTVLWTYDTQSGAISAVMTINSCSQMPDFV
jgi:hypothetical protein